MTFAPLIVPFIHRYSLGSYLTVKLVEQSLKMAQKRKLDSEDINIAVPLPVKRRKSKPADDKKNNEDDDMQNQLI